MTSIDNIYRLLYCSINPTDNLKFNTYFIKCYREGKVIKDTNYNYFKKYYGLYWIRTYEQIDFHNIKIKVSHCCACVGDVVKPYTMFYFNDTIYIFYSTVPLTGYYIMPIDDSNFWFGPMNKPPVYIHCFNAIPNTSGIISYNRHKKPILYLDNRDFMPGCY